MSIIVGDIPQRNQPVLFLDFDDVVNVVPLHDFDSFDNCGSSIDTQNDTYDFDIEKRLDIGTESGRDVHINIRVSSEMIDDIKSILDNGAALLWLTSWKSHTVTLNDVLGFAGNNKRTIGYVDWKYRGFSDSGMFGKVEYIRNLYRADYVDEDKPLLDATNRFVSVDNEFLTPIIAGGLCSVSAARTVNDERMTSFYTGIKLDGYYGDIAGMSKVNRDIAVGYGLAGNENESTTFPFMTITPDFRIGLTKTQLDTARAFLFE